MGFLSAGTESGGSNITSLLMTLVIPIAFVAFMYFGMIRPQRKKDKQAADMRQGIEVGDQVTTIGGIIGRVVSIKDEAITIETGTGTDKTKIKIQRWAINSVEKRDDIKK